MIRWLTAEHKLYCELWFQRTNSRYNYFKLAQEIGSKNHTCIYILFLCAGLRPVGWSLAGLNFSFKQKEIKNSSKFSTNFVNRYGLCWNHSLEFCKCWAICCNEQLSPQWRVLFNRYPFGSKYIRNFIILSDNYIYFWWVVRWGNNIRISSTTFNYSFSF